MTLEEQNQSDDEKYIAQVKLYNEVMKRRDG